MRTLYYSVLETFNKKKITLKENSIHHICITCLNFPSSQIISDRNFIQTKNCLEKYLKKSFCVFIQGKIRYFEKLFIFILQIIT